MAASRSETAAAQHQLLHEAAMSSANMDVLKTALGWINQLQEWERKVEEALAEGDINKLADAMQKRDHFAIHVLSLKSASDDERLLEPLSKPIQFWTKQVRVWQEKFTKTEQDASQSNEIQKQLTYYSNLLNNFQEQRNLLIQRLRPTHQGAVTPLQEIVRTIFQECSRIPGKCEKLDTNFVRLDKNNIHSKTGTKNLPAKLSDLQTPHMHLYKLGTRGFIKGGALANFATMKTAEINTTVMLGPSGCGKTRKIYEYLNSNHGYFIPFKTENDKNDGSVALAAVVQELHKETTVDWNDANPNSELFDQRRERAEYAIRCVLIAYAVVFDVCGNTNPIRGPRQWLYMQLFPIEVFGIDIFRRIAQRLFVECIPSEVNSFDKFPRFACFVDEAQVLGRLLENKFYTTRPGERESNGRQPLLSAAISGVHKVLQRFPIISGTGLTLLSQWSSIVSGVADDVDRNVFTDFPRLDENDVSTLLRTFLKYTKAEVEHASSWLVGRPRLVTSFITGAIKTNMTISGYLPMYVAELTEKEIAKNGEPVTFADSFNFLARSPADQLERLANEQTTLRKRNKNEFNRIYEALTDAFLLSAGWEKTLYRSDALLELGLGFPDNFEKRSARVVHEPLVLEAALKLIDKDFENFICEFLRAVSEDHSCLGKRFELIAALKLAKYLQPCVFDSIKDRLGELWSTYLQHDWKGISREFGRIGETAKTSDEFYSAIKDAHVSLIFPDDKAGPDAVLRLKMGNGNGPLVFVQCKLRGTPFNVDKAFLTIDPRRLHHQKRGTENESQLKGTAKMHKQFLQEIRATPITRVLVAPLQSIGGDQVRIVDNGIGSQDVLFIVDERNANDVLGDAFLDWLLKLKGKIIDDGGGDDE